MAGMAERLYFRQLLAGRDFAGTDPVAGAMVNFVYAVGDRDAGEAVLVDPAYAVGELVDLVEADGLRVTGALVTHYHPDHAGGDLMGHAVEGRPPCSSGARCRSTSRPTRPGGFSG
jgi:glyoxylase-like metal-dependent hydrolase (beta-lactamase superfamily II)